MWRFLLALALFTPVAAHADPISIFIALEAVVGATVAGAIVVAGSWIAANAVYIALAYNVYSATSARRAAKRAASEAREAYNRSLQDRTITALSAEPAERYFYGSGVCGGDVVAIFTSDKVKDGKTKKDGYKHIVIVVTSHRIKSIKDLLIDGIRLGITGTTGWATAGEFAKSAEYDKTETAPMSATSLTLSSPVYAILSVTAKRGLGRVSPSVPYTLVGNTVNFPSGSGYPGAQGWNVVYTVADTNNSTVYAEKFLGTDDQTANAYLMSKAPGQWASTDRLRGRSGVVVTLDLEEPRFQGGIPRLSFDIEGRDEVFDPRDSTFKYTTNAALCIDDWLRSTRWGFGVTPDVDSTIEAANACDVSTPFDAFTYPSDGTGEPVYVGFFGPRYTLNGGWTSADDKETVLGQMAAAMGGRVIDGASWMIQAGAWTTPVLALVDGDEAGPIQVLQTGEAIDDIFNSARASYLPAGSSTVADMNPPYQNSTFVAADGRELWEVMTMPFTDHPSRVRNLARIAVETTRNGLVIQYPAKLKAWELRPGQRVTITNAEFAWDAKTFRVTDWQFGLRGAVVLTLVEDAEDAWDLSGAAIIDPTPNTGLANPNTVAPITSLAAFSGTAQLLRLDDGTVVPRVLVTWTQSSSPYMDNGHIEVAWRNVLDTDWALVNGAGADTSAYLLGVLDGSEILLRVTVYNSLGVPSTPVYSSHYVLGKNEAPSTVTGLTAAVIPSALRITWDECTDVDYSLTRLRYGSTWGTAVALKFDRKGTSYEWAWPPVATYTIWAAHEDTSGNVGTPVSYGPVTVTAAALAPDVTALLARVAAIDSDGVLSRGEKPEVIKAYQAIADESTGIYNQGTNYGLITLRNAYITAANNLTTYLGTLSPSWSDTTVDTPIVAAADLSKWADYYAARQALLNAIDDETAKRANWDQVSGQSTYRVISAGYTVTPPATSGIYRQGALVGGDGRSYTLAVIRRSDGAVLSNVAYDVYSDTANATALAAALNATSSAHVVVVHTADEPQNNRLSGGLSAAMYRCGASRAIFGSPQFKARSAYVLVGIPGCGEGNGAEAYQGAVDDDPNAWVDLAFQIVAGNLVGVTANYTPRSLQDYGYTGDLAATRNKLFKQDTDPAAGGGDVQDGDRWQQTTSGVVTAIYDRVSGAWSTGPSGPTGAPGASVYTATVYKQTGSAPSAPSGGSYNFSTGTLTPPSGWSASQPATTTTPTYATEFTFTTTTPATTVTGGTWTSPVVDAVAGSSGTSGAAVFTVEIYLQTGSGAPSAPSGGSYTFTGDSLTPPSGWTRNKPASSTTPTYRCGYTFTTTTPGTAVTAGTWSTPVVVAQNGADGIDAVAMALSAYSVTLQANNAGTVSDYSPATTTAKVMRGSTDDTSNWTISRTNGSGVTSSLSGAVLTVSALTGTTGYVDLTATRSGFATQTARFTLAKIQPAAPATGSISDYTYTNVSNGGPRDYGYLTASVSGGTSPYSYAWSIVYALMDNGSGTEGIPTPGISSYSGNRCDFRGTASNAYIEVGVECLVTDANGLTTKLSYGFTVLHGTYMP